MKTILGLLFLCIFTGVNAQIADLHEMPNSSEQPAILRHVVLFKFKKEAPESAVVEIEKAFAGLPAKIAEIKTFEWGTNNSPEGLDKGFTHCFVLTFESEADRDKYLPHPDHKQFGDLLSPWLEDVLVLDYWAQPGVP
jgi:hypothetical protein